MADNAVAEEKAQNERIRNGLRKMIKSFDSYIKEASDFEQLEDNLKHMEETDGNFHRYDLVEFVRDKIETNLGDSIERNVNDAFSNLKFDGDIDLQNRVAQKICSDIIKTKEVAEFKNSLRTNILKANENLTKNFYTNFIESNSDEVTLIENENKSISFTNDFDFSSPDNSMNHNSFVFFTSEQFPSIAKNLDPNKSDQLRLRAIQQLLSIPACDPQAADHWVDIRKYINYAFRDPNEQIAELCLKLHSRTLASSHYKVSIEIYKNLIDHLSEYFIDKELDNRMFKSNINMLSTDNAFILRLFRLINDYTKDVSFKWARYPDTFIESIIDESLDFFSLGNETKFGSLMTPVHYLSLLDIQANWFSKWMHGHESRKVLLNSIKIHETFLSTAIQSIILYSSSYYKKGEATNSSRTNSARKKSISSLASSLIAKRTIYKKSEIEYAHFVHSVNVIRKILCFKNGRKLFPVKIPNRETVTIKELIKIVIQLIFDTASSKTSNEFSPSKYAYDLLQELCVAEDTCDACLCNEEVIDQLLKPIKTLMQNKKTGSSSNLNSSFTTVYDESCMLMIANVLSKLASTENGYRQILFNNSKQIFSSHTNKNTAAHVIASFVRKALKNQLIQPLSNAEISEYLYLVRLLYSQCQGEFLIKEYGLNKLIAESWRQCDSEKSVSNTPRQATSKEDNLTLNLPDSLLDNLLNMASTPKGVFYLNETELLNQVTNYLFKRYKSKLQVGKYEKFGYGFLISQLANTPSGCFHLNEAQIIQSIIDDIWLELEFGTDDFMSAFPRAYSIELIDREVYKPMLCLVNILSSFSSVYELISDVSATPRSFYGSRDFPKGLVSLLDRVTFLDKKSKISSLCNFEQSHIFGLKLISILQSDLDVLLLLEIQYNSTNILLNLQKSNRAIPCSNQSNENDIDTSRDDDDNYGQLENVDEGNETYEIMVDALSVERNFVLVNSNLIGGSNEKLLPKKNFTDAKTFSYEFPLFDKLPIPDFYVKYSNYNQLNSSHEFEEFIKSFNYDQIVKSEDTKFNWKSKFQALYLNSLRESKLNIDFMSTALSQFVKVLIKIEQKQLISSLETKTDLNDLISKTSNFQPSISSLQKLGIEKSIQYGYQINQFAKLSRDELSNNLTELNKFVKNLFKISNSKSKKSQTKQETYLGFCQEDSYPGYDWFTSTIFIMNNGDLNSSMSFLYNFHFLQMSSFVWPSRLFLNDFLLSNVFTKNGINILLPTTCHYIELILKQELPLIFSAFRMSGLSPSQICSNWLKQCFWNYFNWPEIVTYISVCIVYGIDYQAYFCVSVLKHLNEKSTNNENGSSCINQNIVQNHTNRDLQIYLKESQIENFKIENYIDFMMDLEIKYRKYILEDIKQIFD